MELRMVGAAELRRLLPMPSAIDALERVFADKRRPDTPLRTHVETPAGDLLVMPATGDPGAGVKLVTVAPGNPARGLPLIHAVYVLFAPDTLEPVAIVDGSALTALRTAAVSGLATRHLARADARRLVIFGAGVQATAHLEAMRAVRPVERVTVVSRSGERVRRLVEAARAAGLQADAGTPSDVTAADLVCTCTTSAEPVFDGSLLAEGAHVNAVGSYRPDTRELDETAVVRARLVVETREAALEEAGDLLIPMAAGLIDAGSIVADLGEVVRGAQVRSGPSDVTVFKSVGVAFEDLAVAAAALAAGDRAGG